MDVSDNVKETRASVENYPPAANYRYTLSH